MMSAMAGDVALGGGGPAQPPTKSPGVETPALAAASGAARARLAAGAPSTGPAPRSFDPDALILHQVHPVKLAVDGASAVASLWLLWRGRTGLGFAVHYLAPLAASALLLRGDLDRLRVTRAGQYLLSMPQGAHALRAAGDTLMVRGARRHEPRLIAAGLVAVAAGWSSGLLRRGAGRPAPVAGTATSAGPATA
jgi:hypothetical protein